MPIVAQQHPAPSTLATVIGQVIDAFGRMADATPILVGKQYFESFGVGIEPRVLFVPETRSRLGPPLEMGNAASMTHSCQVFVRAKPGGTDVERFAHAYALTDLVVSCLEAAGSGRIQWGELGDASPVDVESVGPELSFGFTFKRDIRHDAARWALPPADLVPNTPVPRPPPGQAGTVADVDVEVEVAELEDEED